MSLPPLSTVPVFPYTLVRVPRGTAHGAASASLLSCYLFVHLPLNDVGVNLGEHVSNELSLDRYSAVLLGKISIIK